ncbi:MAG: malate dehydrogenase [Drouetiella hepatica Uher 2000/2452]|jgi:malate dehydrogenase|uniref:Malate dehydrogenase n=1 Tax=Drouetiella hepatica Uher 2000/2452 TaxID=904376 RepID=A0A951Q699_9CYAN|nr:malate dehydrogenase [Drouetiella hepatica Uher 2000/2452]
MTSTFPSHRSTRVSIIGSGNVGGALAQRIAEKNLADVVLLDVLPGRPQGIALDLMQSSGIEGHGRKIMGTCDYADTHDSDIVVLTAGLPRKPGMSRDDLLRTNAEIVTQAAKQAIAHSPEALIIVVTNPLDPMTYLAWKASGLPPERVMGMAGILDSARFQTFIALEMGISPTDIRAMVLGSHGDLMVPLPRYSTVSGVPITELLSSEAIARVVDRTRKGGAEVVELLKTGGAYYAPASSTCLMVEAILRNQPRLLPVAAYLQGQYGLRDLYIGVPVKLGCGGIEEICELELTAEETSALHQSAAAVRSSLDAALLI